MLPEKSPPPAPYYPAPPEPTDHPDRESAGKTTDPAVVSYALTLFTLGVLVGLLAVLSRVAHELQSGLLNQAGLAAFPSARETTAHSTLPSMIADLDNPLVWFVALGFGVASIAISASGIAWFSHGKPELPHERRWTRWAMGIALLLVISAGAALFVNSSSVRLMLMIVPAVGALIGFTGLVLMIVNFMLNPPA